MDDIDRKIIELLAADARQSLSNLGSEVGLSPSAVNERVRRMIDRGAIRRVMADADPAMLGLPILALIWIALAPRADEPGFRRFMAAHPAIVACHHVTGPWDYLAQVRVASLDALELFLAELKETGWLARSETNLALSEVTGPPFLYRSGG